MLLNKAIEEARERDCGRIFLVTTNDNLNALGFYQKRGFELVTIYRSAVNASRKIKPSIPWIGMNNIPLRDEIELEMTLRAT
jgi:ribosomal protein S18 acetylase RimI-like enzyme